MTSRSLSSAAALVALIASVLPPSPAIAQGCVEITATAQPGQTVTATIDGPAWFEMADLSQRVYRVTVTGPEGAAIDLWDGHVDTSWIYLVPQVWVDGTQISGGESVLEWTDWSEASALLVTPPDGTGASTVTVTLVELATDPAEPTFAISAAAHRTGVGGAVFATDLWVFNPSSIETAMALDFLPEAAAQKLRYQTVLEPWQVLLLADVVRGVFGLDDARGALLVSAPRMVVARSRIFTVGSGGTFGQGVAAEEWHRAAGAGQPWGEGGRRRFLPFLAGQPSFRTNVGFVEVLGIDAELELELLDDRGASVVTRALLVPALSHLQIDDLPDFLGVPDIDGAALVVTVANPARVFAYASVIDNRTQDATFIPAFREYDALSRQIVPAAASTSGAHGTLWRTDLGVLPVGPATAVTVEFLPSDGSSPVSSTVPFAGSGLLVLDDVVAALGATGSGALELDADHAILAVSRTYNQTPEGTFGQLVVAHDPWGGGVMTGSAVGVESSPAYRTNVGMFNASTSTTVDVLVRLVAGDGTLLGSRSFRLVPRRHFQVNNLFSVLGVADQSDCRVDFIVSSSHGPAFIDAYASVVDNRTGDPTYIPAVQVWSGLDVSSAVSAAASSTAESLQIGSGSGRGRVSRR